MKVTELRRRRRKYTPKLKGCAELGAHRVGVEEKITHFKRKTSDWESKKRREWGGGDF